MRLPIGYDDFGLIKESKLDYIDKSLFIKEIIDDKTTQSIVITRPRRFGKTLNLSMLHNFFSSKVMGISTLGLFNNLKISQQGYEYMKHQGKYPVISISFKDINAKDYKSARSDFTKVLSKLFFNYQELLLSKKLTDEHKNYFLKVLRSEANESELKSALQDLTYYLYLHHEKKIWLLVDEYDSPIQKSYSEGYYDEMIVFMRGLLGNALKNNPYLNKAVITGILRIAKESLFSGVNNLKVYSLLHKKYGEYFGFTESEVDDVLKQSNLTEKATQIKTWYNGYRIGESTVYNPWSIANCVQERGELKPYWINTSDNQLIKDLLKQAPLSFKACFEDLMSGKEVKRLIDENMVFADLNKQPDAIWSLLLMSGYLTPVSCEEEWLGTQCQLRVPNQEVSNLYRQIVGMWLSNGYGLDW